MGREALVIEACVGTVVLAPDDLTDLSADGAAAELMKRAAIALSAANRAGPEPTVSTMKIWTIERAIG